MNILGVQDVIIAPVILLIFILIQRNHASKKIKTNPNYKYYMIGYYAKIGAGIAFCLIYTLYYDGGDTTNYYKGGVAMAKLYEHNSTNFFRVLFGKNDLGHYYYFNSTTGYPPYYMWKDANTFFVIRMITPVVYIAFKSYIASTVILATFAYIGVWKLYLFFTQFYPKLSKEMAISILFVPSVVFWGSGIMKDTFTFSAACWFIYNINMVFFKKQNRIMNIIIMVINIYLIISIKPYIIIALVPGTVFWAFFNRINNIKSSFVRVATFPVILVIGFFISSFFLSSMSEKLGSYASMDKIVEKAQVTKEDLTREEQYGENYYDIGEIEGGFSNLIALAPKALIAGLYRPFIWEASNIVMLLSALENSFFLYMTLFLLIKMKPARFFKSIFSDPLLLFSFTFSMFFLYAIGLSSANFGALVRYKIPAVPYFLILLFVLKYQFTQQTNKTNIPENKKKKKKSKYKLANV